MDNIRYKCNSTLDQMRVELRSKLDPEDVLILGLLGRDGISQKVGSEEEPMTTEDIEDVEYQQINGLRNRFA
jgi:hypothetical protein